MIPFLKKNLFAFSSLHESKETSKMTWIATAVVFGLYPWLVLLSVKVYSESIHHKQIDRI